MAKLISYFDLQQLSDADLLAGFKRQQEHYTKVFEGKTRITPAMDAASANLIAYHTEAERRGLPVKGIWQS